MDDFEYLKDFEYTPLTDPSSEIRLVSLQPDLVSTEYGLLFRCSLQTVPLSSAPEYVALSYSCGDSEFTLPIIVNSGLKFVTLNLRDFLLEKDMASHCEGYLFWIDQISINQADHEEKSFQVSVMMTKIFRSATSVIIWLGPDTQDSNKAFKFLGRLYDTQNEVRHEIDKAHGSDSSGAAVVESAFPNSAAIVQKLLDDIFDRPEETLGPLRSLVLRSWWRRVWIQQEMYLARTDRTVMTCGLHLIEWAKVVQAEIVLRSILLLFAKGTTLQMRYSQGRWSMATYDIIAEVAQRMVRICRNGYHNVWPSERTFEFNLFDRLTAGFMTPGIQSEATLSVDHVFAVLNISADAESAKIMILIDYSKSTEQVFSETARYLLQTVGAPVFGILGIDAAGGLSLPSWAPNWLIPLPRTPLCRRSEARIGSELYAATGSTRGASFQTFDSRLEVKGTELDLIKAEGLQKDLFPKDRPGELSSTWALHWLKSYLTFQKTVLSISGSEAELVDVLWRVPIADQEADAGNRNHIRASRSMSDCYDLYMGLKPCRDKAELMSVERRYGLVMNRVAANRMPFITSRGHIGLGPTSMEPEDKVFIVLGCQTPIVLREAGNEQFRIIGEAYVYGFMDGEFMRTDPEMRILEII